jgi:hypothetical protein
MAEKKSDELEVPEFDERQFVEDTKKGSYLALMSLGFGILMAVVSEAINRLTLQFPLAFIIGLFAIAILIIILRPKYDMKPMDWFSSGGIYVLTWICFWILFTNPPFS